MTLEQQDIEDVPRAVQRFIQQHGEAALRALGRRGVPTDAAVHDARKEFKQIRAALRLLRHAAGRRAFDRENHAFRDASRPFSDVRDARVMIDTLDALADHFSTRITAAALRPLRRALQSRRRAIRERVLGRAGAMDSLRAEISAALLRIGRWKLEARGWGLFGDALAASYHKARRALHRAEAKGPEDDAWHECRKRCKDLRYQFEMIQPLWPDMIDAMADGAHAITDALGLDHDLAVLGEMVREKCGEQLSAAEAELLLALIDERRLTLKETGRRRAADLFAERPKLFAARLHAYWKEACAHALAPAESD